MVDAQAPPNDRPVDGLWKDWELSTGTGVQMIRALVVVALLAGCGGSATTPSPGTIESPSAAVDSSALCVAFDRIEREIEPVLDQTDDPLTASMTGLTVVTVGADIADLAADADGQVADDLVALGEAFQHQGSVIQATAANPDLPPDDPMAGTDLYAVLRSRYDC